jgi:DHA2 family multidrug resistance protein
MAVLDIQITNASCERSPAALPLCGRSFLGFHQLFDWRDHHDSAYCWLGRVFGTRLYLLVNVSLFLLFSGLCGTATELTQMIIYRTLKDLPEVSPDSDVIHGH